MPGHLLFPFQEFRILCKIAKGGNGEVFYAQVIGSTFLSTYHGPGNNHNHVVLKMLAMGSDNDNSKEDSIVAWQSEVSILQYVFIIFPLNFL